MYEQNLRGIKSSPIILSQHNSLNYDRNNIQRTARETVTINVSDATFFDEYTAHNNQYVNNRNDKQQVKDYDNDERQDRKRGLFRNRLFSTWTGLLQANEKKVVGRVEENCDIVEWKIKQEEERRRRRQNGGDVMKIKSDTELSIDSRSSSLNQSDLDADADADVDIDGGYAWIILIVMFVINGSTFGTARAYGLIFENSARRDEQSRSEAALPFTIMGAIENMAGPLTGYLLARTGSWRMMVFAGSFLITLSHLIGAYFDSKPGQILTIGLMCGIGQSFISISSFQINNAYFVRYRSRAFGIGLTGAAMGTFYISPLCQYVLDNHTKSLCYLMLGFILLPNVFLSLLLKPKGTSIQFSGSSSSCNCEDDIDNRKGFERKEISKDVSATLTAAVAAVAAETTAASLSTTVMIKKQQPKRRSFVFSISSNQLWSKNTNPTSEKFFKQQQLSDNKLDKEGFWRKVIQVISTPVFHLIWPTQLMFCWLNFVFGMIITDFGKDRGLNETQNSHLIVIWALGQLFGRLCLGSLIDLQILSHRAFTIICFASISLITFMLNNFGQVAEGAVGGGGGTGGELASNMICLMVFILSMFISTLYILFNGLVVNYMDKSLTALSIGISSFTGSFFLLPRANIIGYYRDTCGNYNSMLTMFTYVTLISALIWLIMPPMFCSHVERQRCSKSFPSSPTISNQRRPVAEKFETMNIAEHLLKDGNKY